MLLTIDIGNTNIVFGCFRGDDLIAEFRLKTDPARTIDEYRALLFSLFERAFGKEYQCKSCVISSVVPPVTPDVVRIVRDELKVTPLIVGPGTKTGLPIKINDPSTIGADRVVNAVAVKELFGCPAIVVDFGTATSFDFVSKEGTYEGGIIAPGVTTSLDALVRNTAKLPRIELAWPKSIVGKSTVQAMQTGSVVGYCAMVDGLVDRMLTEVGPVAHIIATGGLGRLFTEHSQRITQYDPHLTLKGMKIIASLNK